VAAPVFTAGRNGGLEVRLGMALPINEIVCGDAVGIEVDRVVARQQDAIVGEDIACQGDAGG